MPDLSPDSYRYIEFLTSPDDDQAPRHGTLWPHQWESFLRVVYAHEILGKTEIGTDGLLLNVVTGGGKTAIMAALTAWLRIAYDAQKFVMICPNLIVRDRLEDDFQGGKVFADRGLLPDWTHCTPADFALTTLGGGREGGWASLLSASVVVGNIHQFYQSNKSGQSNLSGLMNGPDFRTVQRRGSQLASSGVRGNARTHAGKGRAAGGHDGDPRPRRREDGRTAIWFSNTESPTRWPTESSRHLWSISQTSGPCNSRTPTRVLESVGRWRRSTGRRSIASA